MAKPVNQEVLQPAVPVSMPGSWLFGNARQFTADPLGMMMKAAAMGRIVRMRFLTETAFMLRDPEDIKWALVDNHRNYLKGRGTQALQPILGQGLLTSEDDLHQRQRHLVQPAFHRQRIASYAQVISRFAGDHLAAWQDGQQFDLHEEMMRLTMEIVAQCLFDVDVSGHATNLGDAITKLVQGFDLSRVGPVGQFIDRFDPDRFSPEAEAARPKFAYFPFGGGPRRCIGEPFAWMEGELLVAALAHRYHIVVQPGYMPELQPLVTLRPKQGMPVTVHRRQAYSC